MFTGIVEEVGEIVARRDRGDLFELTVRAERSASELERGASVAVSGVCLTVTGIEDKDFAVDVANETASRTHLGGFGPGRRVNLELPLRATSRLGGHFVQGHVDTVGRLEGSEQRGGDRVLRVGYPKEFDALVVEKGSIAIDGVSLTVTGCGRGWLEIMLIPYTLEATTLGDLRQGDPVNLEYDILAKYLVRLAQLYQEQGGRR